MKFAINRLACFVVIVLLLPSLALAQLESYMDLGKKAFREKRYSKAIGYFDRVAKENPTYPEVYVYRGLCFFENQDYFGAEVDFQRALDFGYNGKSLGRFDDGKPYPRLTMEDAAKLHNNRGIALYQLGEYDDAMDQFREAFLLDGSLRIAKQNHEQARQRRENPREAGEGSRGGGRYEGIFFDHRPQIPAGAGREDDNSGEVDFVQQRRLRLVEQGLRDPKGKLKIEEFDRGGFFSSGSVYKKVSWAYATQSYVRIIKAEIDRDATYLTFRVINPSIDQADVCIADRLRDGAFYLTDKSGRPGTRFKFQGIVGEDESPISLCPQLTYIEPGQTLIFTLEFERIPDDMRYINVIEGNRNDGNQWNFYMVDLSKK